MVIQGLHFVILEDTKKQSDSIWIALCACENFTKRGELSPVQQRGGPDPSGRRNIPRGNELYQTGFW